VRIKTTVREAAHTSTPAKKYPRNAESADHSTFYANAFAIKERSFGPESIEPKNFTDPVILDLIEKITIEVDPSMTRGREGMSVITTKDGRQFEKRIDTPHGFGDDPLTDGELEDKFRDMASKYMGAERIQKIFDTVWNADRLDNVNELTRLMVFPSR
jgi:2-methylcitrate dehydratase PrpD